MGVYKIDLNYISDFYVMVQPENKSQRKEEKETWTGARQAGHGCQPGEVFTEQRVQRMIKTNADIKRK